MATEKAAKPKKVRLDILNKHAEFVKIVQAECASRTYDQKKVEERLSCRGDEAKILITLARLADAKAGK
jgi:hypothetical protein